MECVADDVLTNVSIHVLENHAFLFPEREDVDPSRACATDLLQASVQFGGAASGELILCVPIELANEIAADILGVDIGSEDAAPLIRDAVGELANVLCGNVLKATEFKAQVLDLAAPEVSAVNAEVWKNLSSKAQTIELSVDDHRLLVHFRIES